LQPIKYHPEGDSYNHTMIALDESVKYTSKPEIRYAVLVYDLGKGDTKKEKYPHHYNHEINGIPLVKSLSKRLKVPNSWLKCGVVSCKEHMRGGIFKKMKASKQVDFIEKIDKSYLGLDGLQIVVNCDRARGIEEQKEEYQFENIGRMCLEKIKAQDIKNKYKIEEGIILGKKIREERILWIKNNRVKY